MTITVTSLVAGPFTATGAEQTTAFGFKVFSDDEIEVYYGADETVVDPADYTVDRNISVAGDALEGGDVTVAAGAIANGETFYIRAVPEFIQEQTYTSAGTRLENLNEALDRGALRDIHMRDLIDWLDARITAAPSLEGSALRTNNGSDFSDKAAVRVNLGDSVYSILNELTAEQRATVLAGGDPGNIGTVLAALISTVPAGSTIDASMLRGDILLDVNPFDGVVSAPIKLVVGACNLQMEFGALGSLALPHGFDLCLQGSVIEPSEPLLTWTGQYTQGLGLVSTGFWDGLASGLVGATTLAVPDGSYFRKGSQVAVSGIVEYPDLTGVIVEALTESGPASFTFTTPQTYSFPDSIVYLKVENEILLCTISGDGATATNITRGVLGTTAAAHVAGSSAVLMVADVFEVQSVAGNVLTLDHALPRSFTDARWWTGAVGARVSGYGLIDGGYDRVATVTKAWSGILSTLSKDFAVEKGIDITRCFFSAVFLLATKGHRVRPGRVSLTGDPATNFGSSVWLFAGAADGACDVDVCDDGYIGVVMDSKSSNVVAMGLIGQVTDCQARIGQMRGHTYPVNLSSSLRSSVYIGVDDSLSGPYIDDGALQNGGTPSLPVGNRIEIGHAENLDSYVVPVRVANPDQNTVIINGRSGRVVEGTLTVAADYAVNTDETMYVTYTLMGTQTGDKTTVLPGGDLANGLSIFSVPVPLDNGFRIGHSNTYPFAALVPEGFTFLARAEGPWDAA